jgi:hypothetical protein
LYFVHTVTSIGVFVRFSLRRFSVDLFYFASLGHIYWGNVSDLKLYRFLYSTILKRNSTAVTFYMGYGMSQAC